MFDPVATTPVLYRAPCGRGPLRSQQQVVREGQADLLVDETRGVEDSALIDNDPARCYGFHVMSDDELAATSFSRFPAGEPVG